MARPRLMNMKETILTAVEELITTNGVNDLSLADIANKAGISKGTLYYHYASKDDILMDLIEKHIFELRTDYVDWLERHKGELSPERFLTIIFYKGVKLFNRAKIHIYLINECLRSNPSLKNHYNELWGSWQEILKTGIEQVFPDLEDKETYSYLLMLIIDGLVVQEVLQNPKQVNEESLVKMMVAIGGKHEANQ